MRANNKTMNIEDIETVKNWCAVISRKAQLLSSAELLQEILSFSEEVGEMDDAVDCEIVMLCREFCKAPYYMLEYPSAKKMAQLMGISYQTLVRRFSNTEEGSYSKVKSAIRIEVCKELLFTGMPVKDIALLAGFNDHTSMSRMFKSSQGVTISEYRDSCGI